MTKAEITKELIEKYDIEASELKSLSKDELETRLQEEYDKLSAAVLETEVLPSSDEFDFGISDNSSDAIAFQKASPDWSKHLMDELTKEEKEGNAPKITGLRRLANKYYPGWSTQLDVVQAPMPENKFRAAVCVTVYVGGLQHSDIAECTYHNTEGVYRDYPLATSQTRAEGRALKKLLGLNVSTFEEIGLVGTSGDKASDTMINALKSMASKKKMDLDQMAAEHFPELESVELMTKGQANTLKDLIKDVI
jgi:hypothetical protein